MIAILFAAVASAAVKHKHPAPTAASKKKKAAAVRARARVAPPKPTPVTPRPELLPVADLAQSQLTAAVESHIENPVGLASFFEALSQAPTGSPVHILQFGDSHTASDDWVHEMRTGLQTRFGNGGPGFTLPGYPFRGYRRYDISGGASSGWVTEGTVMHPGDGETGLGGLNITATSPNQTAFLRTAGQKLEIHYLRQPAGGSFELSVDGRTADVVSTKGEPGLDIYRMEPSPGDHEYRVRTLSNDPVRLFGWVSDRANGVTFETLGINGAQAYMIRNWDLGLFLPELVSRRPSLVVLEYGTNEANSPKWTAARYIAELQDVLARIRRAVPAASILMIGPPDCGKLRPLTHLDEVIRLQHLIAHQNEIAFWDWRDRMGGPRSIVRWAQAGYGQPDQIHLTGAGYRLIGRAVVNDLMAEYSTYLTTKLRTALEPAVFYEPSK